MLSGTAVLARVGGLVGILSAIALGVVMLLDGQPVVAAALPWVLWLSMYLGLGFALAYGQLAYYQHARLRRLLYDRGHIADDYPVFLNQTAERNLLRKVGGGYTFVHALLLQYFSGRG